MTTGAGGGGEVTLAGLLQRRPDEGDRPFLTFYDDARGDRVELSYKTFDNWVRKLANLLVEEYGAAGGARVATVTGVHWQASAVHAACWYVGAVAVPIPVGRPQDGPEAVRAQLAAAAPAVTFVREEWLQAVRDEPRGALVALCADPFGRPALDLGATPNFSRIVPAMPDDYDGDTGGRDAAALLLDPAGEATLLRHGELLDQAAATAAAWELTAADRVAGSLPDHLPRGTVTGLLAPFRVGAGAVRNRAFSTVGFWERVASERVSVVTLTADEARHLLDGEDRPAAADRLRLAVCVASGPDADLAARWQQRFGVPLTPDPGGHDAGGRSGR